MCLDSNAECASGSDGQEKSRVLAPKCRSGSARMRGIRLVSQDPPPSICLAARGLLPQARPLQPDSQLGDLRVCVGSVSE